MGGIYSWAEKRELVSGPNPAHGIETARGEAKDRVLDGEELLALGKALDKNEAKFPMPVAAVRLIAMTGLRRDEACASNGANSISPAHACGSNRRKPGARLGRSARPLVTSSNPCRGSPMYGFSGTGATVAAPI
jgi:hypothetical protein